MKTAEYKFTFRRVSTFVSSGIPILGSSDPLITVIAETEVVARHMAETVSERAASGQVYNFRLVKVKAVS